MKKINIIYIVILGLTLCSSVFAIDYPSINGRTINPDSTFGEYADYYFHLLLAAAVAFAFFAIVFAGINYLISGDNVSKRADAKRMIFNALFGLFLAFGTLIIINTINPAAQQAPSEVAEDTVGINFIKNDDRINWYNHNIMETGEDYKGIEWLSDEEDLPLIYIYSLPDFKGTVQEIANGNSIAIPKGSSVWFFKNKGVFVYDSIDYKLTGKTFPLCLNRDNPSLHLDAYGDCAKSIKFSSSTQNQEYKYGAILFTETGFRGTCFWAVNDDIPNLNNDSGDVNNPTIGNDTLSSAKLLKVSNTSTTITIYNRSDCQEAINDKDKAAKKCDISEINKTKEIKDFCPDFEKETVLSIKLSDNSGVLLKANNDNCQFFEKLGNNNCLSLVKYGYIYYPDSVIDPITNQITTIRPKYLTLFSLHK